MKASNKLFYEAPSALVFEVKSEGVICTSDPLDTNGDPLFNGFGNEELM